MVEGRAKWNRCLHKSPTTCHSYPLNCSRRLMYMNIDHQACDEFNNASGVATVAATRMPCCQSSPFHPMPHCNPFRKNTENRNPTYLSLCLQWLGHSIIHVHSMGSALYGMVAYFCPTDKTMRFFFLFVLNQ